MRELVTIDTDIKSFPWRIAKGLSYIEDARFLNVNLSKTMFIGLSFGITVPITVFPSSVM